MFYEYVFGIGGTTTTRYYLCSVNDRVGDVPKMLFPGGEVVLCGERIILGQAAA